MNNSLFRLQPGPCLSLLAARLAEPAPGRIQLLAGPRQVGKTTILLALADQYPDRSIYAAADGPEAAAPGFWERLWERAEALAADGAPVIVLLDEAHVLPDWAARLKGEWDRLRRRKLNVHIVATGSSALHLAMGSRESLAGRFERVTLTHWTAAAVADRFKLSATEAVDLLVSMGAYPGAVEWRGDRARWTAYVRDAIVEPAIGRDILALAPVRKPALLRQVFGACTVSPAQIVSLQKMQGQLQDRGALETIAFYLSLLEEAFLVAPIQKFATRPARQRAAPPKLVALSNALLAVADPRGIPERAADPARYGAWVENACLAHAWNQGQRVRYWREEPLEVDAVLDGSWGSWAIEVKTGAIGPYDLRGLGEFTRRYPKHRPLVLGDDEAHIAVERAGFTAMSWRRFLVEGLGAVGRSGAL
jgi:predicted AAA+ superfamily ATPase